MTLEEIKKKMTDEFILKFDKEPDVMVLQMIDLGATRVLNGEEVSWVLSAINTPQLEFSKVEIAKKEVVLTEEQKAHIREILKTDKNPEIKKITQAVFNNPTLDGRSMEGKAVKKFLAEEGVKYKTTKYDRIDSLDLTEENKKLIHAHWEDMSIEDMARIIWTEELKHLERVVPWCLEYKTIQNYIANNIYASIVTATGKVFDEKKYMPPKNIREATDRINRYVCEGWDFASLNKRQKDKASSLRRYLNSIHFVYRMNNYRTEEDRNLFEGKFIQFTHDKEDLTEEQQEQFINLAVEIVISEDTLKRMEPLKQKMAETVEDPDGKISMSLNEAIKNYQEDYNQSIKRQQVLHKTLNVERKNLLEQKISENASVLNLVQAWKSKESRDKIINMVQRDKKLVEKEIDKFMSMDELKGLIAGIDPETAKHG